MEIKKKTTKFFGYFGPRKVPKVLSWVEPGYITLRYVALSLALILLDIFYSFL